MSKTGCTQPQGFIISWGVDRDTETSSAQEPVVTVGPTGGRVGLRALLAALGNPRTPRFPASWTTVMGWRGNQKKNS
jgi:hypothetical protein